MKRERRRVARERRRVGGVSAIALLVSSATFGCHVVSGIDDLSLREDAELEFFETFSGVASEDVRAVSFGDESILVAGTFGATIAAGDDTLSTTASEDTFVVRLDDAGEVNDAFTLLATEWARPVSLHGPLLTGRFAGDIVVGGAQLTAPASEQRIFLADLSATPAFAPLTLGGEGFTPYGNAVDVARDGSGNIVIGGGFRGTLELPGDTSACPPFESGSSNSNLFLASFAPDANDTGALECRWSFHPRSSDTQLVESVAYDLGGSLVVGGEFVGKLELPGAAALESTGGVDFFLARIDPDMKVVYAMSFGDGQGVQRSLRVSAHLYGNVAIAGYFEGRIDFGGGPIESSQGPDIVVAKYGPSGKHLFTRHLPVNLGVCAPASCSLHGLDVAFDAQGNVLVASAFSGKLEIAGVTLESASDDRAEHFLAKLNPDGELLWSGRFGGAEKACDPGPCPVALAVDDASHVLSGGFFDGLAELGDTKLESTGPRDAFVARFLP